MRSLILGMFVSLDGFVSGPGGEVDWIFRSGDEATDEWILANLWEAGAHAMGRRTFSETATFWPASDLPFAAPMNAVPKVVFTRTGLADAPGTPAAPADGATAGTAPGTWADPIVARGDLAEEVARLKAQPGSDVRVLGGASLARDLAAQGLVDEYRLLVCPVALGQGVPLFSGLPKPLDLELMSIKTFGSGAVAMVYRPR